MMGVEHMYLAVCQDGPAKNRESLNDDDNIDTKGRGIPGGFREYSESIQFDDSQLN